MDCRQIHHWLDQYLDGDLAAPERERLEAHVIACPSCRRELDALEAAQRALRTPEFRAAPPGMLAEFHRRVAVAQRAPAARPSRAFSFPVPIWTLRAGAGTVLAATAAALLLV